MGEGCQKREAAATFAAQNALLRQALPRPDDRADAAGEDAEASGGGRGGAEAGA